MKDGRTSSHRLSELRRLLRSLAALVLAAGASACGPTYDVVIEGGRVMDPESGLDAVRNIGIVDGRVEVISGEPLEGARHIQAAGLVVAPGFVDLHRHGHSEQAYRLQVRDGVTTGLELEIGTADVEAWYASREGGQLVNYGVSMGHIGARAVAMGDRVTGLGGVTTREPATEEQIAETERLIRQGLAQGAIGVGLGSAYTPGAPMAEIERMFAVAADAGVTAFIHMRGGLQGLDRDRVYAAIDDADVADRVQARLRIHYAAALDYHVVGWSTRRGYGHEEEDGDAGENPSRG